MVYCYFISSGFVREINILLIVVDIILIVDLFNHLKVKNSTLENIQTYFYIIAMDTRVFVLREMTLVAYLVTAILGIRHVIAPTVYKYATYMMMSTMLFITLFSLGISTMTSTKNGDYYSNMMLEKLWIDKHINKIESQLDCCGKNGMIDYKIANRSWEPASCCGSPNCNGCAKRFFRYLRGFEMEVARDNIILLIFLGISMVLMFVHNNTMMMDNEISQQDEDDEEEMLEQLIRLKQQAKMRNQ